MKYREKNRDKIREAKPTKSSKKKVYKKKNFDDESLNDGSECEDWVGEDSDWLPEDDLGEFN